MPTANEQLRDAVLRHQVALARYSSGEVRKILELLDATNADLEAQLVRRLAAIADGRVRSAAVTERLKKLLDNIRTMRLAAYREAGKALTADLIDLGRYEAEFGARMIQAAAPIELILGTTATIEQVAAIVRSRPFQGLILRDWVAVLADQELRAVERAVNIGMAEGEGIPDIVRRIVGSKKDGVRGVLDISRRNAETWVRTAVSHTANETRDALYAENADILNGVAVLVTLDNRTCPICIPKDGLKYSLPDYKPIGHSVPWGAGPGRYHPQDRCTSLPWMKSWKELGVDLDEAPETTRASMNGQVPANTKYKDWIRGQPASVQDEVLGPVRAKAMREGRLKWDDMFSSSGQLRGVKELGLADRRLGRPAGLPETEVRNRLNTWERGRLDGTTEHARLFAADGRDLGVVKGTSTAVTVDADRIEQLRGGIFSHNHPGGTSFSPQDYLLAESNQLAEMRAVGRSGSIPYRYTMKPGAQGWPPASDFATAWNKTTSEVLAEYERAIAAGKITPDLANRVWQHDAWKKLASSLGFDYKREIFR